MASDSCAGATLISRCQRTFYKVRDYDWTLFHSALWVTSGSLMGCHNQMLMLLLRFGDNVRPIIRALM